MTIIRSLEITSQYCRQFFLKRKMSQDDTAKNTRHVSGPSHNLPPPCDPSSQGLYLTPQRIFMLSLSHGLSQDHEIEGSLQNMKPDGRKHLWLRRSHWPGVSLHRAVPPTRLVWLQLGTRVRRVKSSDALQWGGKQMGKRLRCEQGTTLLLHLDILSSWAILPVTTA